MQPRQVLCLRGDSAILALLGLLALVVGTYAGDVPAAVEDAFPKGWSESWPAFRGPDGIGVSHFNDLPDSWNEKANSNILWKAKLALPGLSSPVIWGNRVFVSAASSEKREVYCFDISTGKQLWTGTDASDASVNTDVHVYEMEGMFACPTPVVDGKHVFVLYANGEVVSFDIETGKAAWVRYLGAPNNGYGMASSLLWYKGTVIVPFDGDDKALIALDCTNGKEKWKARRNETTWASPILVPTANNKRQIVVAGAPYVSAYDADSGASLWYAELLSGDVAPSPILAAGNVIACFANCGLFAIKPVGKGDVTTTQVAWQIKEFEHASLPDTVSPVTDGTFVYLFSSALACIDAASGKMVYEKELPDSSNYASPMVAGNKLYLFTSDATYVVQAGKEFKLLNKCSLNEVFTAAPACAPGRLLIRTPQSLYCIGKAAAK